MSFWDKVAGIYDITESLNGKVYKAMLRGVKQIVPEGAKVLDCAAGTGELSVAASEKAESVVCTDLSLAMLEQARKKCKKLGIGNITFEERDIFHMSDEDETYDIVMAGNVLHLVDNPEEAVKELYRVTKKGGKIILPTFVHKNAGTKALIDFYKKFGFNPASDFTAETYSKMLNGCNLGPVKVTFVDGLIPLAFAVMKKR